MSTTDALDRPVRPRPGPRPRSPRPAPDGQAAVGAAALAVAPVLPSPARPEPARAPRPRHLRVVAPSERTRRRLSPATAVLASVGLLVVLFAVAVSQTVLVQGQARLDELDAQLAVEQARYQELRLDVAQMESPERIVAAAHERGMVTPDDLVYLQPSSPDLPPDGTTGQPDPTVAGATDLGVAWSTVKPLLGEPTP